MFFFEIVRLIIKVFYRLIFTYPNNYKFIENKILLHGQIGTKLPSFNFKKLQQYSCVATIGITCLEQLANRKATDFQKKSMIIGCAIAPIIDDLMDEKGYSAFEIQQVLLKNTPRGSIEEQVCIGLLIDLATYSPKLEQAVFWSKAIDYQINSNKKCTIKQDQETLIDLCFGKGGYGLLLAMSASFPELLSTENGRNAFYHVGAIIQYVDDLFDVWKDREEGQQTLVVNCLDINELSLIFEEKLAQTNLELSNLFLERAKISAFIFGLKCYSSLGKIALIQLKSLQNNSNGLFDSSKFSRKELVTDMAKLKNQIKYLKLVFCN